MDGKLYTRDGQPCRVRGDKVFDRSGVQVGRLRGRKVFGPDGQYAATVVGDRLVYRASDAGRSSTTFSPRAAMPSTAIRRAGSSIRGDEPFTTARG